MFLDIVLDTYQVYLPVALISVNAGGGLGGLVLDFLILVV
jgi:hypothetical protein